MHKKLMDMNPVDDFGTLHLVSLDRTLARGGMGVCVPRRLRQLQKGSAAHPGLTGKKIMEFVQAHSHKWFAMAPFCCRTVTAIRPPSPPPPPPSLDRACLD